jgi:hypothetical protein
MSATTAPRDRWPACWAPGQDLVVADVAAQQDELLLAVHSPPELRTLPVPQRGNVPRPGDGEPSSQDVLLDHVLGAAAPEKTLIVPVIGAPGTGKSHLVRWMLAALPPRPDLVVRHIPREGTSLPQVVTTIFEGLEGDVFDDLRNAMASSVSADDGRLNRDDRIERVATRLLARMAEDLEFDQSIRWEAARDVDEAVREALVTYLPTLLREQGVLNRLRRSGGAAYRLAKLIVEGQDAEEHLSEDRLGFTADDVDDLSAVRGLGAEAMRALNVVRVPGQAAPAATVLTDALNHAAPEVIGLRSVSLVDLLKVFRQRLQQEGKELLLLFEDIAIARGLQADLIDALTTPGKRPDSPELCTLRVVMAVTATYWEEAPETLSSRARGWKAQMFSLDVPTEQAEVQATSLIGRYFNAARIGQRVLAERTTQELLSGVENVCDRCEFKPRCHPVFGTSADGHGLFPLTARAAVTLGRLADRALRPRAVLTEVVSEVLGSADDVTAGRFPQSAAWRRAAEEAISARRLGEVPFGWLSRLDELSDEAEQERARLVLRLWIEPGVSADPILRELAVEVAVDDVGDAPPPSPPPERPGRKDESSTTSGETPPPAEERWVQELQRWGGGTVKLTQQPARVARNLVWSALDSGIRWFELGENAAAVKKLLGLTGQQVQNIAVDLGGTEGGRALSRTASPLIALEPTVPNASTLIALHKQSQGQSLELLDLARIDDLIERGEQAVRDALDAGPASREHLTGLAKLLALTALPLSREIAAGRRPDLDAALTAVNSAQSVGPRAVAWTKAVAVAEGLHRDTLDRLTAAVTRTQGRGGAPTAFDHAAIDRDAVRRDPYGLTAIAGPDEIRPHHTELVESLREAVAAEGQRLRGELEAIATHAGAEDRLPWQTMLEAAQEAMVAAARRNVLRPADVVAEVRAYNAPSATDASKAVADAWVAVRAADRDSLPEAVYRLAMVDTAMVGAIREHLDRLSCVLEESAAGAAAALDAGAITGTALADEVRETVAEVLDRAGSMVP